MHLICLTHDQKKTLSYFSKSQAGQVRPALSPFLFDVLRYDLQWQMFLSRLDLKVWRQIMLVDLTKLL